MKKLVVTITPRMRMISVATGFALAAMAANVNASENSRSRQAPLGLFGGEIAAPADNPGFFGTALYTYIKIDKVADNDGNNITTATSSQPFPTRYPLPTGVPTKGAVPDGTYALTVPAGDIDFHQTQKTLTLLGGYLTESTYADGHLAFSIQANYHQISRTFVVGPQPFSAPATPAALPAPLKAAVGAVANAVYTTLSTVNLPAALARQNQNVDGLGDTELSAIWIRHKDRLKIAAGVSLFTPTGAYDKNRGPNPGVGNFYSLRPGVAVSYSLNPNHANEGWDKGITVAGRVSYMVNGTNKDTDYRTGNLLYTEAAVVKVVGSWAFGTNLMQIKQTTDDSGSGALSPVRYKLNSVGPFLSFKLPGQDAGFNLNYSHNFGGRNAQLGNFLQARFIKAW